MSAILAGYLPHLEDDPRFRMPKPLPFAVASEEGLTPIGLPSPNLPPLQPYSRADGHRRLRQPTRKVIGFTKDPVGIWWTIMLECGHPIRTYGCVKKSQKTRRCRTCVAEALAQREKAAR